MSTESLHSRECRAATFWVLGQVLSWVSSVDARGAPIAPTYPRRSDYVGSNTPVIVACSVSNVGLVYGGRIKLGVLTLLLDAVLPDQAAIVRDCMQVSPLYGCIVLFEAISKQLR